VKIGFDLQRRLQAGLEGVTADFNQTELRQVRVMELRIQQHVSAINEAGDEMHQRDL
jgi:hypothetical protein